MIVRRATIQDVPQIARIHVLSWQRAYADIVPEEYLDGLSITRHEVQWNEILQQREARVLVAETAAQIVGWIGYGRSRDDDAADRTGEVYAVYVDPACWSTGIGSQLWTEARQELVGLGFERATLWVLAANERAIRFYRRAGFELAATSGNEIMIGGRSLPEVRFELELRGH